MTHTIKGRSFVTQNANNVVFVVLCFIKNLRNKHIYPFSWCSVTDNQVHPVNSVATSPQQVPLFLAQPERLQQGLEKTESASEAKIRQAINGRHLI